MLVAEVMDVQPSRTMQIGLWELTPSGTFCVLLVHTAAPAQ